MRRPVQAAIALGSNLGDREANIRDALARIAALRGVRLVTCSRLRESAPVGGPPQGPYLNGVALVETATPPRELLESLHLVEEEGGRTRKEKDGPRTIDLDLIFHGHARIHEPGFELPHPRAHLRAFVLEPLAEVAPTWRHPVLKKTARELLDALRGRPSRGEKAPR